MNQVNNGILLESLREYQRKNNLSDAALARMLDLDDSTISKLLAGGQPGAKVLRRIAQRIPELTFDLMKHLREEGVNVKDD